MKTCNKIDCKQINPQPLENFYKDKNNKTDGHYSICKQCKETGTKKWRSENREQVNATVRAYAKRPERMLKNRLKYYEITPEEYLEMIKLQDNKCKLCFKSPPTSRRPLVVDHNHVTGKVRGLLCYGCNRLMVLIDNAELLKRALAYAK